MHEPHGTHDYIETAPFYIETTTFLSLLATFGIYKIFDVCRVLFSRQNFFQSILSPFYFSEILIGHYQISRYSDIEKLKRC